jgi:hypothetical protein
MTTMPQQPVATGAAATGAPAGGFIGGGSMPAPADIAVSITMLYMK